MAITSGTKLGPYEIQSPLGAGGMGEVYRARDTRLNRDVAIKVLPLAFAGDPERLRRFQQEAQAIAALNHPNILAIHDFGTHEGSPYLVTEFLEGETLRDRLRPGAIPVRKAIEAAEQIARGLAVAHDKGIVHRDLKPENIFITRDGRVKILDFGLAKLTRPEATSYSETLASQTDIGVALGTVGYMSPEQVRGQVTGPASDLFSFGAILLEMLAGKRAFRGETAADTMGAILKEDPPELAEVSRQIPPALERIVRHCLEKNPEERFQSARDVAFDLESLSGISSSSAAIRPLKTTLLTPRLVPVLVGLLLAVAAYLVGGYSHRNATPVFHRLTYQRGRIPNALFSPDGHTVVYSASWNGNPIEVYSTRSEFPEPHSLALSGYSVLGISASNELALGLNHEEEDMTLARAPMAGGAPRPVLEHVGAAAWAPDDTLALVRIVNGQRRLEYPVGRVLYETPGFIDSVRFSPKGDHIAFLDHPVWPDSRGSVDVVDLNGRRQTLTQEFESETGLAWSPRGDEIWYTAAPTGSNPALYAVKLSGHQRLVLSIPGQVLLYDIASDGRVLLSSEETQVGLLGRRSGDSEERDLSWFDSTFLDDISADGQWLLLDEEGVLGGPNYSVGMRKLDGSPVVRLGDGNGRAFSPDGKWAISMLPGEHPQIVLLPTGVGQPRRVETPGIERYGSSAGFLPNGQRLFFTGAEAEHGIRTYTQDLNGSKPRAITPEGIEADTVSPDGKYLAGLAPDRRLTLYPVDGGSARPVPRSPRDCEPIRWSKDGSSLLCHSATVPTKLYQVNVTSGKAQPIRELIPADPAGLSDIYRVVVAADARTYAYGYLRSLSTLYVVQGLK